MKSRLLIFTILIIVSFTSCTVHEEISQTQQDIKNNSSFKKEEKVNSDNEVDWFVGAINGNLKIHMKLTVENDKVSGVYYYDTYKKNIELTGDISNNFFTVYEKNLSGSIEGVFISDELIEGVWSDSENTYTLYLIKEGSNISIPKEPDSSLQKWEGDWKGIESGCYAGSELIIYPVFDNLIKFQLTAFNGTHIGDFSALALFNNDNAIYKGEDDIEFRISLDNEDNIRLDTSDYSYSCGYGVAFDSIYTKKILNNSNPSAKEVGLVYSDEQEAMFKELTGDYYNEFIQYAQFYTDEEDVDEIGADVRLFHLRGYSNASIVMINQNDNTIMAAIDGGDAIYYFTNNKAFTNPPKTIEKWYNEKNGLKVIKIIK